MAGSSVWGERDAISGTGDAISGEGDLVSDGEWDGCGTNWGRLAYITVLFFFLFFLSSFPHSLLPVSSPLMMFPLIYLSEKLFVFFVLFF